MTDIIKYEQNRLLNIEAAKQLLAEAIRRGGRSLGSVPGLLERVLQENAWQKRIIDNREIVVREFRAFVELEYPEGLGTTIETLQSLCQHHKELYDFLANVKRGEVGRPPKPDQESEYMVDARGNVVKTHDNIMNNSKPIQQGTSAEYAYNKLRDEAYHDDGSVKDKRVAAIHKQVLAGEISPHRGMVQAGFRKRKVAVNMDDTESAARTIRKHMEPALIVELIDLLRED